MHIDREHLVGTLAELVRINSVNPAFSGGTTDEAAIAEYVATALEQLGMQVDRREPEPGRVSVVGRLAGEGGGRSLMLYAHMDTVGVDEMEAPFAAEVRDGRMYGRGAYDMKCGLAACMAAARALVDSGMPLRGDLLVVGVADEETASIGMADVLTAHRADAAIVTEPTELQVCLAHKGFCWLEVETFGRAAHGSRFEEGIDANMRMGRFLAQLDHLERKLRSSEPHPLVGPPSLHAAVIQGGTGTSTYASHCRLEIERRMIPGETEELVVGQVQEIIDRLAAEDPTFQARVRPFLTRDSFELPPEAPIARLVLDQTERVLGQQPPQVGMPYWMDAALLAAAGIETVVIGPTGHGAHAAEEWVELESVFQVAQILARTAADFCA